MPKNSYQLINPSIEGSFKTVYEASAPMKGAVKMWKNFAKNIYGGVPKFYFTMKNTSSGKLHNFAVREDTKTSEFTIEELDLSIDKKKFNEFAKKVQNYNKGRKTQKGGASKTGKKKRYTDSSSDSSDSDDIHTPYPPIVRTSPITLLHYYPEIYVRESILNPSMVAIETPIYTPVIRTFPQIAIWTI